MCPLHLHLRLRFVESVESVESISKTAISKTCFQRRSLFEISMGLVLLLLTLGAGSESWGQEARDERPNVLVILVDDLGYSDPGYMGGEIATPNLDALAEHCVRFTQCYNSARCCPSRAALMTGLYPHQAGIGSFVSRQPDLARGPAYLGRLNEKCVTLAEVMKGSGYQTFMVGKWHLEEPGPIARGFDEFYGFVHGYEQDQWQSERYQRLPEGRKPELSFASNSFYATDAFTDYAIEFLKQARQTPNRPWFLYVAHSAPHFPVQAPRESVEPLVPIYQQGWDILREQRFERMKELGLADASWALTPRSTVPLDQDAIANGFSGQVNPAWQDVPLDRQLDLAHRMAIYAAMVEHIDQGLGRLFDDLRANGEWDNTLIIFTSDNGACYEWGPWGFDGPSRQGNTTLHVAEQLKEMGGPGTYHAYGSAWANLCNTPLRSYKHFTHEGGNCSSLLIHWPREIESPGRWCSTPIHLFDVMPTLCEATESPYPLETNSGPTETLAGTSLLPLLRDPEATKSNTPWNERDIASEHNGARSLRRGRWKIVWPVRAEPAGSWELYDLQTDRCELHNLALQHPDIVQTLSEAWMTWARKVQVHPFQSENDSPKSEVLTPRIANRSLEIHCTIDELNESTEGVILAHGGDQMGYSLHVQEERLYFTIRVDRQPFVIDVPLPSKPTVEIRASLSLDGEMGLSIDSSRGSALAPVPLIPREPIDRLSIGQDEQTAVGDYRAPFPFNGKVRDVKIEVVPNEPEEKE